MDRGRFCCEPGIAHGDENKFLFLQCLERIGSGRRYESCFDILLGNAARMDCRHGAIRGECDRQRKWRAGDTVLFDQSLFRWIGDLNVGDRSHVGLVSQVLFQCGDHSIRRSIFLSKEHQECEATLLGGFGEFELSATCGRPSLSCKLCRCWSGRE